MNSIDQSVAENIKTIQGIRSGLETPVASLARGLVGPDGVLRAFIDANGKFKTVNVENVGAVASNGGTVSVVERGVLGLLQKTDFTFTAMPLTLLDASTGAGAKIYDFPEGSIYILGAFGSVYEVTTSALATTLNTGVTYNWGIGTVTQSNGTLATTEQDILPTTNGTASATINVAGAVAPGARVAAGAYFDGTGTAKDAFFNVGIAGATDIDGNATTLWTGTASIIWMFLGDK